MAVFNPRPYQAAIIRKAIDEPYVGAFLDMGLGKTAIALSVIEHLAYRELEVRRVLIVAPKSVVQGVWQDEADKWEHTRKIRVIEVLGTEKQRVKALNTPGGVVFAINYENLAWLCGHCNMAVDKVFDMVIFDESSKLKSHASVRFKACKKAMEFVPRIMLLTGTPAPNGYLDLWAQVYLLDRGERLGAGITRYRERYFTADRYAGFSRYELRPGADKVIGGKIGDICVSLSAADCLGDLPEIVYLDKRIELSAKTYSAYKDFERTKVVEVAESMGLRGSGGLDGVSPQIVAANAAALRGKLLQFTNGAVYLGNDALGRPRDGYSEFHDEKIEYLLDVVDSAGGRPMLVTYQFRHDLDRLAAALKRERVRVRQYQSVTDKSDWNAGKIEVLLVHPASAGYGLNLQQGGSIVTWFGLTDSLEQYQQLNARLHRSGQRETVRCVRLMCKGTEDERAIEGLAGKDRTQAALLAGLKAKFKEYL